MEAERLIKLGGECPFLQEVLLGGSLCGRENFPFRIGFRDEGRRWVCVWAVRGEGREWMTCPPPHTQPSLLNMIATYFEVLQSHLHFTGSYECQA